MKRNNPAIIAVLTALAAGFVPDLVVSTTAWAEENFVLVDGPYAGQKWKVDHAPYLKGIFDEVDDDAVNIVTVRKSAQVAFTTAAMAWIGKNIDTAPADEMVIFPTLASVHDFNRQKLQRVIDASPALRRRVRAQKSRSATGSTATSKSYRGGSLTLTGANSAADLRSKTTKRQFRDEIDEWPHNLDEQGDPYGMADARLISFHATGDWKVLEGSTPTIKGRSRIDERFEAGDQRYFKVLCPHCGERQRLVFGTKETRHGLKFNRSYPHNAHYVCRLNGCIIEHHEKRAMVATGEFVARKPGPGRHPSFHLDALISNLTTWDHMAEAFLAAKDDSQKLKAFVNLWLGESWEERGDAPDWKLLLMRAESYEAWALPPGGVVVTAAADVQTDGIYYEVMAWGFGLESWSIDIGFLPGDTSTRDAGAWKALDKVYEKRYADAYGGGWQPDVFAVDAGFNTHVVYDWCRRRPRARAIKGVSGWYKPPIASTPTAQDVSYGGRKVKRGVKLWNVGTWPLKSTLYANLRKEGKRNGKETDPPGFCHFTEHLHDEAYFKQLTSEHLKERDVKGRAVSEWVATGPNHFHDCRIYNIAMAEHLKLPTRDADGWRELAWARGVPEDDQADLFGVVLPEIAKDLEKVPARRKPGLRRRFGGFVKGGRH